MLKSIRNRNLPADHFKKMVKPVEERNEEVLAARPPASSLETLSLRGRLDNRTRRPELLRVFPSIVNDEAAWPALRLGSIEELLQDMIPFWEDEGILQGGPVAVARLSRVCRVLASKQLPQEAHRVSVRQRAGAEPRHVLPRRREETELLLPPVAELLPGHRAEAKRRDRVLGLLPQLQWLFAGSAQALQTVQTVQRP